MLGSGLIQGLAVTAKNFAGSFHDPARYTTVEYPEVKQKLPENYRNFPFLVSEKAEDPLGTLRCVACLICEKECPPQCIYIVRERDEKGKVMSNPKVFDIDISVCMSCQICVEVCPFDAIKMDQVFEIAPASRFDALLLDKKALAKPNTYYHEIHPQEAAAVDAILAEQKAKAAAAAAAKAEAAKAAKPASPPTPAPASPAVSPTPAAPSAEAPKPPPPAA